MGHPLRSPLYQEAVLNALTPPATNAFGIDKVLAGVHFDESPHPCSDLTFAESFLVVLRSGVNVTFKPFANLFGGFTQIDLKFDLILDEIEVW